MMNAHWDTEAYELEPYVAPEWAKNLPHIPEHRIRVCINMNICIFHVRKIFLVSKYVQLFLLDTYFNLTYE